MELKPEQQTEIKIAFWLKEHGCNIFLNRKDKKIIEFVGNYETFKTIGIQKKPDLIFQDNQGHYAVELKTGKSTINILKSCKILKYYESYVNKETKYIINNKEIGLKHFLVGSLYSKDGYLYENENEELIDNRVSNNVGKKFAIKYKLIPNFEYRKSFDLIRMLWQHWNLIGRDKNIGIGLLLSSKLNASSKEEINTIKPIPSIFSQVYGSKVMKGKRIDSWLQHWRVI